MFHRVTLAANLGDDTTIPPNTLPYRNVILWYQANGHTYIYSSDAIPTRIDGDAGDLSEIRAQIAELGGQLDEEREQRIESEAQLQASITELQQDLAETAQDLKELIDSVDANLDALAARQDSDFNILNEAIGDVEKQTVQKDTSVSGDASTVTITKSLGTLQEEGTTATALPLPVASAEAAGVMNAATYNAVQENAENIDSILGGAVVVDDLAPAPTQTELTDSWKTATGKDTLINRASIYDTENKLVWYYYENAAEWKSMSAGDAAVSVSIATNDTPGIVRSSDAPGQITVEPDGSMSQNGYDGMQHDIDNLSQLVAGIEVPKVPTYVPSFNSMGDQTFSSYALGVTLPYTAYQTVSGGSARRDISILNASSTANGVMSSADKSKLDSLLAIKSLNDSLELDENGQLSVVGGGSSDVNLLSTYKATVGDNDAYNAAYVNGIFGDHIIFASKLPSGRIALGYSVALGGASSVVIGNKAEATSTYGVALGANSRCTDNGVSVGSGNESDVSGYRRKVHWVAPGTADNDAVNLKQMQDYVTEHGGSPFTEMETTRVKNLPPAVVTGFEDTTYGTDTIIMHLDTKDLATGGVSVQELMLEAATANTAETGGHAGLMTAFQATQLAALAEAGVEGTISTEEFNAAWEAA